ncbi:MAG: hypothetical protein IJS66_06530 [Bacteroidales bacterium]|nr:hypothetical protein [Bacteroidales bacterium]
MSQTPRNSSAKKTLIIIGAIVAGFILIFVVRAICINASVDHAYDKATKEYNKAYDKAKRDADRIMRDYRY